MGLLVGERIQLLFLELLEGLFDVLEGDNLPMVII
jgi:hypothetical protein